MPDVRQPGGSDRSRLATPSEVGRRASEGAAKAVSDALARNQPALDKLAAPASIRPPDFPARLEAIARRLADGPASRVRFNAPETSLRPPAVTVPEGPSVEAPKADEGPPADLSRVTPTVEVPLAPGPTSVIPSLAVESFRPTLEVATRGDAVAGPGRSTVGGDDSTSRIASPTWNVPRGDGSANPPSSGDLSARSEGVAAADLAVPPGSLRVDRTVGASAASLFARGSDPPSFFAAESRGDSNGDPWQDLSTAPGSIPTAESRDEMSGPQGRTVGVRASLTVGSRGLATTDSGLPGGVGGDSPKFGGSGSDSGGDAPGSSGSTPSQAGGAIDLSKTNELLQQILEAVRRQRDPALPAGGSSVYAGR